jgi:hypothetical protein
MRNAVEIIRHEYVKDPVLRSLNAAYRWEAIMCSTGEGKLMKIVSLFKLHVYLSH